MIFAIVRFRICSEGVPLRPDLVQFGSNLFVFFGKGPCVRVAVLGQKAGKGEHLSNGFTFTLAEVVGGVIVEATVLRVPDSMDEDNLGRLGRPW
jgi:hypothetical protein